MSILNVLIFGETGAGKSSIINLIAGRKVASTSNSAVGCTFEHQRHEVAFRGLVCRLWDTTGLDEGTEGTVPAATAKRNLKTLMQKLAREGGINLVIYCIRAGRATQSLQKNYHVFYSGVCRKKVPAALVVTGCEYEEREMEEWWVRDGAHFPRYGMHFDAHACVTTLELHDPVVQERRRQSQRILYDLIARYSKQPPWKIDDPFVSKVVPTLPGLSRTTPSPDTRTLRTIIAYDMTADSPNTTASWRGRTRSSGSHQYKFTSLDKRLWEKSKKSPGIPVGGLLVFYTSPVIHTIQPKDAEILKKFYGVTGGLTCPMIVVLRGCLDEKAAKACWNAFTSDHPDIQANPLPDTDRLSDGETKLMSLIEKLWVEPVVVRGFWKRMFGLN